MENLYLNHKTTELINSLKNKENTRILFICLGNICRSPAAEGIMKKIVEENHAENRFEIDSAGIGGWHVGDLPDKRMRVHANHRDLNLNHRCRQVKPADFEDFDIIIGMDSQNIRDLHRLAPTLEDEDKIAAMGDFLDPAMGFDHVPDPYYEGAEGFERVLDLLYVGCNRLYALLS